MTTSYTLTGDFASILGGSERPPRVIATLRTNLGNVALVDLDANEVRLSGPARITLAADLTFSLSLIATNSTGTNVPSGTLRYKVDAQYTDANRQIQFWSSGYFELTVDRDLSDVVGSDVAMEVTPLPAPALIDAATAANVDSPTSETRSSLNDVIQAETVGSVNGDSARDVVLDADDIAPTTARRYLPAGGTDGQLVKVVSGSPAWAADYAVPSQAEAEAGTATTARVWTAERVAQAVVAKAPIVGEAGRRYRLLSGTIRNTGSGWGFISDASHEKSGFTGISATSTHIVLNHSVGAVKVSSLQATVDETLAALGYRVGVSVGLTSTNLYIYREPDDRISDFIQYNGSAWVSTNGVMIPSFSAGVLTLTHESMGTDRLGFQVDPRGGVLALPQGVGDTTSAVNFYSGTFTAAGTGLSLVSTPTANMRIWATRFGRRASVPSEDPASVVSANGNIWLTGVLEL